MRRSLPLLAVASVLFSGLVAHADSYVVTIGGPNHTGTLNLTGSATAFTDPGAVFLTSGSGTIDGRPVVLETAPAGTNLANVYALPFVGIFFDNELYPNSTSVFDPAGIFLQTIDAGPLTWFVPYNDPVFGTGPAIFAMVSATRAFTDAPVTFSVATAQTTPAVPEPSTLMLIGTGLATMGGSALRRLRAAKA
jgi:hypothetical protein